VKFAYVNHVSGALHIDFNNYNDDDGLVVRINSVKDFGSLNCFGSILEQRDVEKETSLSSILLGASLLLAQILTRSPAVARIADRTACQ